jgi:hypothetical protein
MQNPPLTKKPNRAVVTTDSSDSIIWGARAIGKMIGRNERQAYHLLETGALRGARKIGGVWSAKRSTLLSQWDEGRD